jgi:hypothetical protein
MKSNKEKTLLKEMTIIRKVEENNFREVMMKIIAFVIVSYLITTFFPISIIWVVTMHFPLEMWVFLSTVLSYFLIAMEFYEVKVVQKEEKVYIKS